MTENLFSTLQEWDTPPAPYEHGNPAELWTEPYIAEQMLYYHLQPNMDAASRNQAFIERSVAWIASELGVGPGKRAADFGCGPGLYTSRFAKLGARVTGIDFSANSIRYACESAAKDGLEIDYVVSDYTQYETDQRFDLITLIYCDFCVLTPENRALMLRKFASMLNPGGKVLLDAWHVRRFEQLKESRGFDVCEGNGFFAKAPHFTFERTFLYPEEKITLDLTLILEAERTRRIYNWHQYFSEESIRAEFAAAGLQIDQIFGSVAGDPYTDESDLMAVVASKA